MAIEISSSSSHPVIMTQETFDPVTIAQEIYTWFGEAGKKEKVAKVVLDFTLDKELQKPFKKNICDDRHIITLNYFSEDTKGPDVQGIILKQMQKIKSAMNQHKKSANFFTFTLTGRGQNLLGSPCMNQDRVWNIVPK
ncbi:MAG: hypothetical protein HYZ47_00505 [Simkania negevensis]|nr:hypothetical protein [Simkania negevensis]